MRPSLWKEWSRGAQEFSGQLQEKFEKRVILKLFRLRPKFGNS